MADDDAEKVVGVPFPGTELRVVDKYPGSHRLDHKDFGSVYETSYGSGIIEDFGLTATDPITLDGTCTVRTALGTFAGVPIFYHCRQGEGPPAPPPPPPVPEEYQWIYDLIGSFFPAIGGDEDDGAGILDENGSLRRGAWAFWKGLEVKVLFQKGKAKAVVGQMPPGTDTVEQTPGQRSPAWWEEPEVASPAPKPPYKCHNIFLIRVWDWYSNIGQFLPTGKGKEQSQGFYISRRKTYGMRDEYPLADQYIKTVNLNLTKKVYRLFGYRELQRGTVLLYYGDWLIKLGPVMLIFQLSSFGYPGPTTAKIDILAALYSKELEQSAIALGKQKEADLVTIPRLGGGVPHFGPFNFERMKYEDLAHGTARFVKQRDFSNYMLGYYQGVEGQMFGMVTPRWVFTEMYTEPIGYRYSTGDGESGGGGGGGGGGGWIE